MQDDRPFAFFGLWEHWESQAGDTIDSCTLLTTEPNDLIHTFHHRIPVILDQKDYDQWLDLVTRDPEAMQPLLRPYPSDAMTAYPISTLVNNSSNDIPECIRPLEKEDADAEEEIKAVRRELEGKRGR